MFVQAACQPTVDNIHRKESKEIPDNKSSCFMQINRRLRARCIDHMGVEHIISLTSWGGTWCKKAACHRWLASWCTYRIHGTRVAPAEANQMGFSPNKWKKSQDFTCIFCTRKASGRTHSDAVLVYSILLILISHFSYSSVFCLHVNADIVSWETRRYRICNSMNYIQVARQETTCISGLVWANVNNVGADNVIGLTSLQLQFLAPEYTDVRVHWCPPPLPVPSPHGCVSEIPDRVLETTFFISWSPETELEAPKRHLSASLSRTPPPPGFGCLLRWSKKMQVNSHCVYSIDVKEKTECSYGGVVDAASATATKATYRCITLFQK